jgi:tetratricopeptide (TPR) repeat protein
MRRELLIGLALAVLTLGIYWPARNFDFIQYDDPQFITENPVIQKGLTPEGVRYALTQPVAGNWHPVTTLSHMLDCELFGTNPGAHHLVNVLLHAGNAVLVFLLLLYMTHLPWRSGLVAAVFALHPLRVESVAWISERKDVLSAFFFLLTIGAYAHWIKMRTADAGTISGTKRHWQWYALILVFFVLALLSKPMVVTLPFVLLLLDLWPLNRLHKNIFSWQSWRPLISEKLPMFALSGGACWLTYSIQKQAGAMSLMQSLSLLERAQNALQSYLKYLAKWLWPSDLAVVYPHPARHYFLNDAWASWQIVAAGLAMALISAFCLLRLRRQPWLAAGWFWYLGMLVPVIGLIQVGEQAMADRYTYLPLIGPTISFVWWMSEALQLSIAKGLKRLTGPRLAIAAAAAVLLLGLSLCSSRQLHYWRDTLALFEHTAAVTADNPSAQFSIGVGLEKEGRTAPAMTQYRVALAIDPNYAKAHYNLGQLLRKESRWQEAADHYRAVLRCTPSDLAAHLNLASTLLQLHNPTEAAAHFEAALRLDPNSTEALNNLAWLLATSGRDQIRNGPRAVELAERACAISEFKQPVFIGTLAAAYAEAGRFEEAISAARRASETATAFGQPQLAARNAELLERYRAKRPFRDTAD